MGRTKQSQLTFKRLAVPVGGQTGTEESQQRPSDVNGEDKAEVCANLKHSSKNHPFKLPKGLVGTKSTAKVHIKGEEVSCLLDTGSQVTTVPRSFYEQHFPEQDIKPLHDLLEVEGANGQSVPYLGYIEMTVTFPKEFIGASMDVNTLALVVPDIRATSQSLVLIGTNTLDVLYDMYFEAGLTRHQPIPHGYRAVLKCLELRQKQTNNSQPSVVTLQGRSSKVIPAGETVVVEGVALAYCLQNEKFVVIEQPSLPSLPGGLLVTASLVDIPQQRPYKLPVVISNESDHDIVIPAKCAIAEISAYQSILLQEHSVVKQSEPLPKSPEAQSNNKHNLNFNFSESPIPSEWRERITQQLNNMPDVFAQHDLDFGRTDKVAHNIKLSDETPFKQRARPIHPQDIEAVRKHIQELLDAGVIRESESPFSSPIVVVRKKNGQVRLCIDYRRLNLQTIKDAYSLPKLEDTFSALSGSQWFSVLDLKSGYYQIEVEEADKPKTAFVCPLGFWEFNRMPQGVTNAPSTFQRLMEKCMGDMHLKDVLVFIDDLIVFSKTLEEHEARLMKVLTRLREFGLKLSPEKCVFFQTSVRYLGHVVSRNGVETDPEKIAALKTWPVPKNLRELRSFLGFAGYYRRFVKGYSNIVKPLHNLTSGYPPSHRKLKSDEKAGQYRNPKEVFGSRWTPACQQAFDLVIESLTSAPVLGFADPQKPYVLHTDASTTGLGAVLYQEQEGQCRVIGYASRGLSRSESRYPAHKLEFLALKWSVTEKFSDYLYGNHFTVVTDSNPLTYILTSAKLDATSYRWLAALSTFSFKLLYRPGKQNGDADGLSRRPHGELADDLKSQKERERIRQFTQGHLSDPENIDAVDQAVVQAICERQLIYSVSTDGVALVETLAISPTAVPDSYGQEDDLGGLPVIPHLTETELVSKQRADQSIKHVISQIEQGEKPPPTLRHELTELPLLLRELNRLELRNNILYRRRQVGSQTFYQLVLPAELRDTVLTSLHNHMGHMGVDRTLDLVRTRFFWPKMALDVERKVKTCGRCVRRKALPERAAPLVNINTTRPLELLCMDFLSLEPDKSGTKDILVITDHFTKFAVAIPTPNQKARTVAKCLWENFMVNYGMPEKLHSDQGRDFESRTIKELCRVAGIHKVRTTPYHPRGNPVERFNRTLLNMLGTLESPEKSRWRDFVKPLVHAYNCTRNEVTGFTPYELMFGRQPRLPVDLAFGLPVQGGQQTSHAEYVQNLKSRLEDSYKIAIENAAKIARKNKVRYDRHVTASDLEAGDRVLVRNVRIRGKHKISDKWESIVHVVVRRAGTLPVYTVKPENQDGPLRTLHRDLLLPCGYLSTEVNKAPDQQPTRRRPATRANPTVDENNFSDDEDEIIPAYYFREPQNAQFPTVHDRLVQPDPPMSTVQDKQHTEPPRNCPVESPVNAQNVDCTPEINKPPDMSNGASNSPLTLNDPNCHHYDTEDLLTERVMLDEQVDEIVMTESNLPASKNPVEEQNLPDDDIQIEQLPVFSDMLESGKEMNRKEPEEEIKDTTVRRSERNRQPSKRLDYTELGNPFVTVVKSFFQGLTTAVADILSEGENSYPSVLYPEIQTVQPLPCTGTYMSSKGESVARFYNEKPYLAV